MPALLEVSVEFDYLTWPKRIQQHIKGKSVIDVGCGFGGYGTGFLAAGATSYLGLDPVMDLDSTKAKNKRIREWSDMGITPNSIQEQCPDIRLFQGTSEELKFDEKFDVISLHNVTEHLIQLDLVFEGMVQLCHKDTKVVFMHHNYYCWNGHHKSPNQPGQIVNGVGKGEQMLLMDWRHIPFADSAPDDHYVKTHLNRVTLDEIKGITSKYFEIEEWNEIPSNKATLERLSDDIVDNIRLTHPHLTKRDLETNVVFAICGAK
jgi:SAM-dependent methyltransferase